MQIIPSPYSKVRSSGIVKPLLKSINDHLRIVYPQLFTPASETEKPLTLTVSLYWSSRSQNEGNDDENTLPSDALLCVSLILEYVHPLQLNKAVNIVQRSHFPNAMAILDDVMTLYMKQQACQHDWQRQLSQTGAPIPDGRQVCSHCKLALMQGLPLIPNRQVIPISMGKQDEASRYDWGNCRLQAGHNGLVVGRDKDDHYYTAFFEAFPDIHGFGTFLRGEGPSIVEAEKACWLTYQRQLSCFKHEWTRTVNGTFRTDGYAKCTLCGLVTSDALPPTTCCAVCNRPTTTSWQNEKHLCHVHYHQQPLAELIAYQISELRKFRPVMTRHCLSEADFKVTLSNTLHLAFIDHMGEAAYLNRHRRIEWLIQIFLFTVSGKILGTDRLSDEAEFPPASDPRAQACICYFTGRIAHWCDWVTSEEKTIITKTLLPDNVFSPTPCAAVQQEERP